jgi:hypothetical protein
MLKHFFLTPHHDHYFKVHIAAATHCFQCNRTFLSNIIIYDLYHSIPLHAAMLVFLQCKHAPLIMVGALEEGVKKSMHALTPDNCHISHPKNTAFRVLKVTSIY